MAAVTVQEAITDGVLIVRKEVGWTSHDVVAKVRTLLGGSVKVGHAGTLDPAATGVLPVLIGRATRVAEFLVEWDKEYRAILHLGETTDTEDATGAVLARVDPSKVGEPSIRTVVERFRGPQRQVPPMYSAVKVGGRPLYKAARAGKIVEREPRSIVIHALEVVTVDGPDVTLHVVCSKGTYIRTLCADIGRALGVGGHMLALERLRVGPLSIDRALTIDDIAGRLAAGILPDHVLTMDRALDRLPVVVVDGEQARRVLHGAPVALETATLLRQTSGPISIRLKDQAGRLLAIGAYDASTGGPIRIQKVLAAVESLH